MSARTRAGTGDLVFDALMYPLEVVALRRKRRELIPAARGRVLEIGAGTGANLPFYRWDRVDELHLLDASLTNALRAAAVRAAAPVVLHEADAQSLPFADAHFDTVVFTLVFCSVADPAKGLSEARRVLRADGSLIFIEHVRPRSRGLARAVDAANPAWRAINGQCNLNRETLAAIGEAGFASRGVSRWGGGFLVGGVAAPAGPGPMPGGRRASSRATPPA